MNGAILLLIAAAGFLGGYFLYARTIEGLLGVDPNVPTPAKTKGNTLPIQTNANMSGTKIKEASNTDILHR